MDSTAISDYHCSNDYESLINNYSSSSSSSSVGGCRSRQIEKRVKSNTVINKIRRFARSQSQIRHGSRGHDYINSDNLVSKTKDLYRDVKRRFSSFNTTSSLEPNDRRSTNVSLSLSTKPSSHISSNLLTINNKLESHHKTLLTCETIQSSSVSRLRRYASDESLPTSESGCGSSVKTSSLSTDSNRSSICTVNEPSNESSVFKGPFIGQGIALADCTPCPYDKDALVFKKGDLVNIIAKNDSGTWIGMANGKIGHFKFINVEEISSIGNGIRSTSSSLSSASSVTIVSSNVTSVGGGGGCFDASADCSNGIENGGSVSECSIVTSANLNAASFIPNHYEDIIRNLLSSVNIYLDNSLKGLFKLIGLDGYDYLNMLKDKGFSSLGSLMNITDTSVLEVVGITCHEHQQTLLSIASIIRKLNSNQQQTITTTTTNTQAKAIINNLENDFASMSIDLDRPLAQSAPTTPGFESFHKPLSFSLISATKIKTNQSSHDHEESHSKLCSPSPKDNKTISTTGSGSLSVHMEPLSSALRLRKKRDRRQSDAGDNIKRAQSGNDILDDDLYQEPKYGSYDHRKSLDTNALIKKLEHGYESRNCDSASTKTLVSSKSVFDLKYNENSHLEESSSAPTVHCSHYSTKKRFKKLLNADRKTITSFDDRRLGITSKPLSSALLDTLSNLLKEENIDLTSEPYSDNSGFCGIPPALVQRYAEELETDVYDIAETLDYIRLCCLLNKSGRQGIPNDFLADSCNGPGTDWANYENLHNWLLSLGLPMYESKLKDHGFKSLWDIISMREDDLTSCGITNKRHLRFLTTAIGALSVNQHKIGKT